MKRPDVIIDLSNVCRINEAEPPRAEWKRFIAVQEAWLREHPGEFILAIADNNLYFLIDDQAAYKAAKDEGLLGEAIGQADDDILDKAHSLGAKVISSDKYRGKRARHPWIQDNETTFFKPVWLESGGVKLRAQKMGVCGDATISRERRKDLEKARRIKDRDKHFFYRCLGRGCMHAEDEVLQELPQRDNGGVLRCPSCSKPVERSARLDVLYAESPMARLKVVEGHPIVLGRGKRDKEIQDVSQYAGEEGPDISRRHASLEIRADGVLVVTDLGSTNGTWVDGVEIEVGKAIQILPGQRLSFAMDVIGLEWVMPDGGRKG